MAALIYATFVSLDGYAAPADADRGFAGEGADVHAFVEQTFRSVGTYLYGRRRYEAALFWETAHTSPDVPLHVVRYARAWQAAEKVVYSSTLASASTERTRIERRFEPDEVWRLKVDSHLDLLVDGPTLAARAITTGLVDEYLLFVTARVAGGGARAFPEGVSLGLELVEQRVFRSGLVALRYRPR